MLKQRVLTALILIPIFVLAVLKLSSPAFCVLTALLTLWGGWEWSLFLGVARFPQCFIYPGLILLALIGSLALPIHWILYSAFSLWLVAIGLIMCYPKGQTLWGKGFLWRAVMGFLVLIPCWAAINAIHARQKGPFLLLYLFVLVWGADIGAYFAGNRWGKHKLCPSVSPHKSWEGVLGGLIVTALIALGMISALGFPFPFGQKVLLLSLITVLFSVVGDLFESMLKRNVGLKDSGQLLPGHGGLLDRIDSLTAAAPIFSLCMMWLSNHP